MRLPRSIAFPLAPLVISAALMTTIAGRAHAEGAFAILGADAWSGDVARFNAAGAETVATLAPNFSAADWLIAAAIVWDRDGRRFGLGRGLTVLCGGKVIARGDSLDPVTGPLP